MRIFKKECIFPAHAFPNTFKNRLLLDIETTGLIPNKSRIYLLGLGEFYFLSDDEVKIVLTQYFLESLFDEMQMFKILFDTLQNTKGFITCNSNSFDLHFLQDCTDAYHIKLQWFRTKNIDITYFAKKFRHILNLNSIKQRDLESAFDFCHKTKYEKTELISLFHQYEMHPDEQLLHLLVLHHAQELQGMIHLFCLPLLDLFFSGDFEYVRCQNNATSLDITYKSCGNFYNKTLHFKIFENPLQDFAKNSCESPAISIQHHTLILHLPIFYGQLKYFLPDCNDYEFLLSENTIIHKSLSAYVAKSNRRKARKEEVFLPKNSAFIPVLGNFTNKVYKHNYSDSTTFLELEDVMYQPILFSEILTQILQKLKLV